MPHNILAFSRTGRRNLNGGKVGASYEASKTVKPGVGCDAGFCGSSELALLSLIIVPAASVEAPIHEPELHVIGPPPEHPADEQAPDAEDEPFALLRPKSEDEEDQADRDQQHGDPEEGELDQDFSHRSEPQNIWPLSRAGHAAFRRAK